MRVLLCVGLFQSVTIPSLMFITCRASYEASKTDTSLRPKRKRMQIREHQNMVTLLLKLTLQLGFR